MDGKAASRTRPMKMVHKEVEKSSLCVSGTLIMMIILLWIIQTVSELPAKAAIYSINSCWTLHIGVLTIILGLLFLIMGLPILASLFLNLSDRLQTVEQDGLEQGSPKVLQRYEGTSEMETIQRLLIHILVTVVTMSALLWGIYSGLRMVTEAKRDGRYYVLTVLIGFITVIFGFLYVIIGLCITAKVALDLAGRLRHVEMEETSIYKESIYCPNCCV